MFEEKITLDLFAAGSYDFEGITAGAKLTLPFSEVVFYGLNDKLSYGVSFFTDKVFKTIPVTLKFGKLSFSGSLGKMNSPLLTSSAAAFSNAWTSVNCITCSLPGTNSFSKNMSSFVQFGFKSDCIVKDLKLNLFYDLDSGEDIGVSTCAAFLFNDFLKIQTSYTAGIFPYDEKKNSSWFYSEKYYGEGRHFCSNFQISVLLKNCSFLFMNGCYETPFGGFANVFRFENQFKGKRFTFNLTGALNLNQKIITSSDKKEAGCIQVKSSLMYKFSGRIIVPVMFKIGGCLYGGISLTEEEHELKAGIGVQAICMYFGIGVYALCNGELSGSDLGRMKLALKSTSVQLKNSLYFDFLTIAANASFSLTPDSKFENWTTVEKIAVNLAFSSAPSVSQNNSVAFTQKNNEFNKFVVDSGVTVKMSLGKMHRIRGTFKISVQIKSSSLQE